MTTVSGNGTVLPTGLILLVGAVLVRTIIEGLVGGGGSFWEEEGGIQLTFTRGDR